MMNGLPSSRRVKVLLSNESNALETRLNRESETWESNPGNISLAVKLTGNTFGYA